MEKPLTLIDLFCGAGGLSTGFHWAGFSTLAAIDHDIDATATYKLNHPSVNVVTKSIANIEVADLLQSGELVTGIIGGPPCQSFSTAGNRLLSDPRAWLFKEYIRLLTAIRPRFFLFENVSGLVSMNGGKHLEHILEYFDDLGYHVNHHVLNAVNFGVPQNRERLFIVGCLDQTLTLPLPTHGTGLQPHISLRDAISDLPPPLETQQIYINSTQTDYQRWVRQNEIELTHHIPAKHGKQLLKLIKRIKPGQSIKDIANHHVKTFFPNSYGRLLWDQPAPTITRNLGSPSSASCIHPEQHRGLTSREGARLQSFPDSYKFIGKKGSINLQIGNAVPPLLAKAIASSIYAQM